MESSVFTHLRKNFWRNAKTELTRPFVFPFVVGFLGVWGLNVIFMQPTLEDYKKSPNKQWAAHYIKKLEGDKHGSDEGHGAHGHH